MTATRILCLRWWSCTLRTRPPRLTRWRRGCASQHPTTARWVPPTLPPPARRCPGPCCMLGAASKASRRTVAATRLWRGLWHHIWDSAASSGRIELCTLLLLAALPDRSHPSRIRCSASVSNAYWERPLATLRQPSTAFSHCFCLPVGRRWMRLSTSSRAAAPRSAHTPWLDCACSCETRAMRTTRWGTGFLCHSCRPRELRGILAWLCPWTRAAVAA